MKKSFIWIVLNFVIFFSLFLTSCNKETSSDTANTVSSGENWWDKFGTPKYGGTITFPNAGLMAVNFDVYNFIGSEYNFWFEAMFEPDWTLDREKWDMTGNFIPDKYWKGNLAESWEIPDASTVIVHIRKGIHWQNKAPVNGREFTAYDVQSHYDRLLGTGGGYTWKAPMYAGMTGNWDRVTAKDKYTVVYKFKVPSAHNFQLIADRLSLNVIEAPEWVALGGAPVKPVEPKGGPGAPPAGNGPPPPPSFGSGPLQDWHTAVGTGPWMLEKYVNGSSFTYAKNPDYWQHDPRFPDNRLPYADKLVMLVIPDLSTMVAAMRTKKIDILGQGGGGKSNIDWRQAKTLITRNPEYIQKKIPNGASGVGFKVDKAPFTDIRVRKALNMAIDRKTIAQSVFGSSSTGVPIGLIAPEYKGYAFDYSDWPQSLKDEYAYNPAEAKKLLAEAGYPKGFKTNVILANSETNAITMMQTYKSYFKDIGVDMDIKLMDSVTVQALTRAGKHDQMSGQGGGAVWPPTRTVDTFYSKSSEAQMFSVNDPTYDKLRDEFWTATSSEKAAKIIQQIDRRVIEQVWVISTCEEYVYNIWQPYLKGYSGESIFWGQGILWSRVWIDKELKK